jgi:hypothetical protein
MGEWHKLLRSGNVDADDLTDNPVSGKYLKYNGSTLEWSGIDVGGEISMSRIAIGGDNYTYGTLGAFAWRYDTENPAISGTMITSVTVTDEGDNYNSNATQVTLPYAALKTTTDAPVGIGAFAHTPAQFTPTIEDGKITSIAITNAGHYGSELISLDLQIIDYSNSGSGATATITMGTERTLIDDVKVLDENDNLVEAHKYDVIFSGKGTGSNLYGNTPTIHGLVNQGIVVVNDSTSPFKGTFITENLSTTLAVLRNVSSSISDEGISYNLQASKTDEVVDTDQFQSPWYKPNSANMIEVSAAIEDGSTTITVASTENYEVGAYVVFNSGTFRTGVPGTSITSILDATTFTTVLAADNTSSINISVSRVMTSFAIRVALGGDGLKWVEHGGLLQFRGTDNQISANILKDYDYNDVDYASELHLIKLGLEQDIATTSIPSFAGIKLTNNSAISKDKKLEFDAVGDSDTAFIQSPTGADNKLTISAPKTGATIELTSDTVAVSAALTVGGDLTVSGTTTTINTTTVEVEDNILQLNTTQGSPNTATEPTSGISIYRGDGVTQASLIFDDSDDTWDLTNNLTIVGTNTSNSLISSDLDINGSGDISTNLTLSGDSTTNLTIESGSLILGKEDSQSEGIIFHWDRGANANLNEDNYTTNTTTKTRAVLKINEHITDASFSGAFFDNNGRFPEIFSDDWKDSIVSGENLSAFLQIIPQTYSYGNWDAVYDTNATVGIQLGAGEKATVESIMGIYGRKGNVHINSYQGGAGDYYTRQESPNGFINLGFSGGVRMYSAAYNEDHDLFNLNLERTQLRGRLEIFKQELGNPDIDSRIMLYDGRNTSDNCVALKCPTVTTSYTLTLPPAAPSSDKFLQSNSSGTLSWVASSGGLSESEVEDVITAELVNGQSIDQAIDDLITTHTGAATHTDTQLSDTGVTAKVLTNLATGASGAIAADDTILEAFNKLETRTALNDAKDDAGTDNSTAVTMSGAGSYISLNGQAITVDAIIESDISDLQAYITSTLTATLDADDNKIIGIQSAGFKEEQSLGSKDDDFTVDFSTNQKQAVTLTNNTMTITLDETDTKVGNYLLRIVNGGLASLAWAAESNSIKWPGGEAPGLTDSGEDIVSFYYNGTDFYGITSFDFQT